MLEKLTLELQFTFYLQYCKDNKLKPQDYKNLKQYINEIKGE